MKRTTALILTLSFALAAPAFAQTKNKVRKGKSTPKVEQTPRTESLESNEVSPTGADAPLTTDPLTAAPAEPLPPLDNPPARPMDAEPAVRSSRPYFGAHAQLGLPRLIGGGVNLVTANERFSFELAGGSMSQTIDDTKISFSSFDVGARYHVFDGAFFVGASLGQQGLAGEKTETISGQSINAKVDIKTMYLTPQLGWMSGKADGGFFFETVLGLQNPMSSSVDFDTNADATIKLTPEYAKLDADVRDAGKKLGEMALPVVAIKIGYLF